MKQIEEYKVLYEKKEAKSEAEKNELKDELTKQIKEWKLRYEDKEAYCNKFL